MPRQSRAEKERRSRAQAAKGQEGSNLKDFNKIGVGIVILTLILTLGSWVSRTPLEVKAISESPNGLAIQQVIDSRANGSFVEIGDLARQGGFPPSVVYESLDSIAAVRNVDSILPPMVNDCTGVVNSVDKDSTTIKIPDHCTLNHPEDRILLRRQYTNEDWVTYQVSSIAKSAIGKDEAQLVLRNPRSDQTQFKPLPTKNDFNFDHYQGRLLILSEPANLSVQPTSFVNSLATQIWLNVVTVTGRDPNTEAKWPNGQSNRLVNPFTAQDINGLDTDGGSSGGAVIVNDNSHPLVVGMSIASYQDQTGRTVIQNYGPLMPPRAPIHSPKY